MGFSERIDTILNLTELYIYIIYQTEKFKEKQHIGLKMSEIFDTAAFVVFQSYRWL